jgi:hypothetical protein
MPGETSRLYGRGARVMELRGPLAWRNRELPASVPGAMVEGMVPGRLKHFVGERLSRFSDRETESRMVARHP